MPLHAVAAAASLAVLSVLPLAALAQHDHGAASAKTGAAATPAAAGFIEISVTGGGFVPDKISVKKGQPVKLLVTRKTDQTCATEILIPETGVNKALPLNRTVLVEFTPKKAGTLKYACAMGHVSGLLVVE